MLSPPPVESPGFQRFTTGVSIEQGLRSHGHIIIYKINPSPPGFDSSVLVPKSLQRGARAPRLRMHPGSGPVPFRRDLPCHLASCKEQVTFWISTKEENVRTSPADLRQIRKLEYRQNSAGIGDSVSGLRFGCPRCLVLGAGET